MSSTFLKVQFTQAELGRASDLIPLIKFAQSRREAQRLVRQLLPILRNLAGICQQTSIPAGAILLEMAEVYSPVSEDVYFTFLFEILPRDL